MGRKVFATNLNKSCLIIVFGIFSIFMLILCIRLGYIQFVKSDEYEKMAGIQQIRDEMILPKRGNILDCNNQELAVSSVTYSVWARVPDISKDKDRLKRAARIDETAKQLENILGMRRSRIRRIITSDKRLVKIAKYRKKSVADRIKKAELPGIYTEEEVKRVYPRGNFMCHELGSVTDDNKGLSGLELYYNSELAGIPGRWLKKTDVGGNPLANLHPVRLNDIFKIDEDALTGFRAQVYDGRVAFDGTEMRFEHQIEFAHGGITVLAARRAVDDVLVDKRC